MIGLGSNRLSVCRRGGMSVTQAGRGGMEWLAGGREPLWAQWWLPYSRQAGEALKAQFPTQWPTIRDYGFAHPALVPFINEDPMLVCSLPLTISITMPDRWLVIDTKGPYINTGTIGSLDLDVEMTIMHDYIVPAYLTTPISTSSSNDASAAISWYFAGPNWAIRFGNSSAWINCGKIDSGVTYELSLNKNNFIANGTSSNIGATAYTNTNPLLLGTDIWNNSRPDESPLKYKQVRFKRAGILEKHFIPYKHPTHGNGMLDLVNLVFYQNAGSGSFTISETPAS